MATFTEKPAAGSYTVNTAHAKCPAHLYLIDEGSGSTLTDRGSVGGLNMTLTDAANMWTTADLTAGGGTSPAISCGTGDTAISGTGLSIPSGDDLLLVVIMASDNDANASGRETLLSAASSASTNEYANATSTLNLQTATARFSNASGNTVKAGTATIWDAAFHMVAAKFNDTTTSVTMSVSTDGAAFSTTASVTTTLGFADFDRLAIGKQAFSTDNTDIFTGKIVAAFVYVGTSVTWDTTWIGELYADPWAFLTTTTTYVRLLAEASAASAASIEGVVLNSTRDTVIGEFSGQAFEAALVGGEAVLLIDVADITPNGSTLTTSDTPIVFAYNATDSIIGPGSATVVEV